MQGEKFAVSFHLPGTLAANHTLAFKLPFASTLIAISSVAGNASGATITVGTAASPAGYMTAKPIGSAGVPVIHDKDDWVGALLPPSHVPTVDNVHINAETTINIVLDFDGAAGTAAQAVTIVAYFTEG
jgi:hypothetical protein